MKLRSSNTWTAAVALGLCFVLTLVIAVLSGNPTTDTFQRPSTFFTDSSGTRGIYLVLQRFLPSVEQWRFPLTSLSNPGTHSVKTLIALDPQALTASEAGALDAWISSGGQLILAKSTDWFIGGEGHSSQRFLARHDISPEMAAGARGVDAAVSRQVGRGRIIYLGNPLVFSNHNLKDTDNAFWLVQKCDEWSGGVAFDEYHLGFRTQRGLASLMSSFVVTPWGLVCAQLALAGAIYLFGCKRRLGRPIEILPVERTNPIETVQALGGVFAGARARVLSARVIHQYVNSYVSAALGYRVDILDGAFRERLPAQSGEPQDLNSYVAIAKSAVSSARLSDTDLMELGRKAAHITRSFRHGSIRNKRSASTG